MAQPLRKTRDDAGQAATNAAVAVVVTITTILAGILVYRVAWTAESINDKAGSIAESAVPINEATDAVLDLPTTNKLAGSILGSAQPLQGKLGEIIRLAKSVDGLASSINGTATSVDGTAKGINSTAAGALETARSIDRGVKQIITNLDITISLAQAIKADTGTIRGQAVQAHHSAACIDRGLAFGAGDDGHC